MKKFLKQEEGGYLAIFLILLPVLIAFVALAVDVSACYETGVRLQKSVDSAAMSYIRELPVKKTAALGDFKDKVEAMALKNTDYSSRTPSVNVEIHENGTFRTGYTVTMSENVPYVFASTLQSLFGSSVSGRVITKKASVSVFAAKGGPHVLPIGIEYDTYEALLRSGQMTDVTVKYGAHNEMNYGGWRGACMPLGYNGASDWRALLATGIDRVDVGERLHLENGNMSGPTHALNALIDDCQRQCGGGCTSENHKADCPRVLLIPVLGSISGGEATCVALLPVYVTHRVEGNGADSLIKCDILGDLVLNYDDYGGTALSDDTLLFTAKLTE